MKYSNTIEYNISTKLDASGLTKFQAELQKIELSLQNKANRQLLPAGEVEKAREQLNGLSQALTKAFNPSLGIIDLSKLRSSLGDSAVNAKSLSQAFKLAGTDGEVAFNNLLNQLGRFDSGIAKSNSSLDKLYTTMSNTFRWGLVSSFFSQFMNGIHSSIDYVKDLDESLTQIMLVTDYNRDSMNEYAKSANEAAKALSMSTTGMTNASLVFAQQGFDLSQSQQLAELSAKLANASQQDTATTSDQITAYMNAYGLEDSIEELTQQMDNWALIANVSAADVAELAEASQRAASMANAVGVSGEQLAAQIATIESVTREAPEQIGNGLKTLYARFSDIAAGKEDEDGFTLGKVTSELQKIGVQVLDSMGQIRDVGDIMEDLMVIWDDLDQTSKVAASQALAGKYQVNRFMALMDNTEMYQEYKGATGSAATGTLDQMNEEYAQSLAGRVQKLQTTLEGIFNNLFDTDDFYKFIDVAQTALDLIDNLTEAMGGGIPVLTALAGLMTQVFSKNMAQEITRNAQNRELDKIRVQNAENVGGIISQLGLENAPSEASQGIVNFVQQGAQNYSSMSTEQIQQYNQILNDQVAAANRAAEANKNLANTIAEVGAAAGIGLNAPDAIFQGEEGEVNTSNLIDVIRNTGKEDFSQIKPEDFTDAAKEAESFAKALVEVEDVFERFKNSDAEGSIDGLATAIEYARDKLITLHESGAISDDTFERMSNTLDNAASHMENWDSEAENAIDDMYKLSLEAIDLNEILQGLASGKINWDSLDKSVQQAVLEAQNARAVVEGTQSMGQAFFDGINTQKMTQGFLDIVGATTSLISAFTTLKNLGSIWNNEDLSMTEKITQTTLNLGSAILTIIPAITNLKKGWEDLQVQELLTNAATLKTNVSTLLSATAIERENLVIVSNTISKKAATKATIEAKAAELGLSGASVKLATVLASLNPILLAVGAAAAVIAGLTFKHLWDEAEKADAQAEALKAINEQINETANTVKESAPKLNELYDEFIKTGEASDEFITALEEQAKALGINNEEVLIASENYITLKGEVDRATESILAANSALLQLDLEKVDNKTLANELSDDQKERYNLTYHQEEGITGYSAGTPVKGNINVLDQTPYEIVQAAQKDIEIQQERINELTVKRNQLIKDGAAVSSDEVLEIDNALSVAAKALSESKAYVEEHKNILEDVQGITDNTLDRELINPDSIFKSGSFEEIKDFISSLGLEGIDTSNIDDFVIKYANLAGNIEAAADAQLNFVTSQVRESGNGVHTLGLIGELGNEFDLSNIDKAKITQLFDWDDPEIDTKVNDIIVKIQEGLKAGLSMDDILAGLNQEGSYSSRDYLSTITSTDKDVSNEELQRTAKYIYDNNDALENYDDELEDHVDIIEEAAMEQLRYNKAVEKASKGLDKWKEDLEDLAKGEENVGDLAETTEELRDTYEDLVNFDAGSLSDDFVRNTKNLELMEAAIQGDTNALDELIMRANADILIQAGLDDDEAYAQAEALRAEMDNANWNDIEIGASLTGYDSLLDSFEDIINAAGMTAEEAQEYLADMGVDAEVKEEEDIAEDEKEAYGWTAEPTDPVPIDSEVVTKGGEKVDKETVTSYIGGFRMVPQPVTDTATSSTTSMAMEVTTAGGKKGGGNLHINRSTARKSGAGSQKGTGRSGGGGGGGGKGGGGKGGGGKGGGGGKSYTPKTKEKVKYDTDRYEKVNTELSKIKEVLEGIEKETDRLYGDDARANVNKRITLLGQEIDLEREKLRIQQQENAEVKKQLTDKGVEFDPNGFISNYNEIIKSYEKQINDKIDEYNAATTEEEQKRIAKEIEALQKEYETVKEGMDRYDELRSEIEQTKNSIEALKDAIEDLAIAAYQASMDAIDNLKELNDLGAKLDGFWSGYEIDSPFRKIIEDESLLDSMFEGSEEQMDAMRDQYQDMADAATEAAEKATDPYEKATQRLKAEYFQDQADKVGENDLGAGTLDMRLQQLQELQRWMNDPTAADNPFGDNTAALYEAYEETYKALGNDILEAEKAAEQLQQDILDGYEDIADKQKENLEDFDRINDRLEHYSDMFELINGPGHFRETAELLGNMMNNTLASLQQAQTNLDYWTAKYQDAIDKGLTKEAAQFKEEMINAQEEVWERSEQYAQQAFDKMSNLVKQQNADLVQSLLGNDMDSLTRDWERDKDYANKYLDTVQRTYETEKLRSKYLDLLDSAQNTSLATQNKIRQAMNEQVSYMEDQVYLSEYNVKYANARLDVLQKQIALENAQQNKNQMKLKRDSQGNYKYVYSANEGDVREAQRDLLDSEFNAYDMSKDNMMQNQDEALAIIRRFTEQRLEIFQNYYGDSQKIQEELQKLTEDTQRDLAALGEEYEDSFFGMIESVSWMADSGVESFTDMATEVLDGLQNKTLETLENMGIYVNGSIDNFLSAINTNIPKFDESMQNTLSVVADFKTDIAELSGVIGTDFTNITGVMEETTAATTALKDETLLLNEALGAEDQKLQAAQAKLAEYQDKLAKSKEDTSALRQQLEQARAETTAKTQEARNYKTVATRELKKGEDFVIPAGTKIYYAKNASQTDTSGNKYMTFNTDKKVTIRELNKGAEYGVGVFPSDQKNPIDMENGIASPEQEDSGEDKGKGRRDKQMWWVDPNLARVQILASMDTGGYTGDWSEGLGSKNGRLALLHQKELVLNAADTQNILQAVEVMRDAVKLQQLSGLTSAAMLNLTTKSAGGGDTIEQRVEITATFPNVNTASEIEQALLSLSDQAYQYSHRMI